MSSTSLLAGSNTKQTSGALFAPQQTHGAIYVNGQVISPQAIAAEAQNHQAPKNKPSTAWNAAARALVMRALLLQAAQKRQLNVCVREVRSGCFETEEEALIRAVLDDAISVERPTKDQVRDEWQRNKNKFRSPPLWEVSHILVACDMSDPKSRVAGFKKANALLQNIVVKPTHFAKFAAEHSDCGSKDKAGALGQLSPGDCVPEFEAALRHLSDGQISPKPVATRHGFHIVKMNAVALGQPLPFQAVCDKIAQAMEKTAWARAAQSFMTQLKETADIQGFRLEEEF